ncbi:hypothetical protein FS749_008419 [Ceratobasidium sp. UAMH 11750]|nr:hypothetical protein FS749_008419 [Ceratobasidium sp. UAMH 11750]
MHHCLLLFAEAHAQRLRRKPTLSDFRGLQGDVASHVIPELIAVACVQGAYEVFGKLLEWSGDTYNLVWGRELGDLRLQKAPDALKSIMVHRISWFRGETKERIRPVIPFAYQFIHPPWTRADLVYNRELAKKLLPNTFHCLDIDEPNDGQYEHPAVRDSIASAFFWRPDAVGMVYRKKFGPVPLPAVAMVLTIMQHCIK